MTKAQLEAKIARMESEMNNLRTTVVKVRQEKDEAIKQMELSFQNQIHKANENAYRNWKELNGEYVKRYIAEMLNNGSLLFELKSDWAGYVSLDVRVDDIGYQQTDADIITHHNPLDE